jgi:hypothetical protein
MKRFLAFGGDKYGPEYTPHGWHSFLASFDSEREAMVYLLSEGKGWSQIVDTATVFPPNIEAPAYPPKIVLDIPRD